MQTNFITLEGFLLLQASYEKTPLFSRGYKSGADYVKHYYLSKKAFDLDGHNGADKWEMGKRVTSIVDPNCGRELYFAGTCKQDKRFYLCNKSLDNPEYGVLIDKYYWWALIVPSELIPNCWGNRQEFTCLCWW